MGSTKEAPLRPSISLSSFRNTKKIKMAEITEEQFQALNDQADAEAALKAKLEEENVALGEKITLDQRIQAHKAELKQQQAFIAKLEAEKAEIANIVNKTRDELTAAKDTAHTLQRQAIDSSRSWPRPRYM